MRGCACRGTAGFAHVSCLAEQAKILYGRGEENNLGWEVLTERFDRWSTCSLCEQSYHGVVAVRSGGRAGRCTTTDEDRRRICPAWADLIMQSTTNALSVATGSCL